MRRRPKHDSDEHDEPGTQEEAAPIAADPDAEPEPKAEHAAPVYPTEADEAEAIAEVLKADPNLSRHALSRAVAAYLRENAARAVRRQRAAATTLADEHAPRFPTEAHALDLREAIPTLSDEEEAAVMRAGYGAFLASIDAREPVLTPATEE